MRKTRLFESREQYGNWIEGMAGEGLLEIPCVIIEPQFASLDLSTECKSWKTALRRFRAAFEGLHDDFSGWFDSMEESCTNGIFESRMEFGDCNGIWSWVVEKLDDGLYYVSLVLTGGYAVGADTDDNAETETAYVNPVMTYPDYKNDEYPSVMEVVSPTGLTAREKLEHLGYNLSLCTKCYEDAAYLYYVVQDDYVVQVDPLTGKSRHKGFGAGCFWTEWEE